MLIICILCTFKWLLLDSNSFWRGKSKEHNITTTFESYNSKNALHKFFKTILLKSHIISFICFVDVSFWNSYIIIYRTVCFLFPFFLYFLWDLALINFAHFYVKIILWCLEYCLCFTSPAQFRVPYHQYILSVGLIWLMSFESS
jgi:hypothetical protein